MSLTKVLASLNTNQRAAVTSSAAGRLQIIAGPGTGKTKVLVSRVAYLLLECSIPPQRLIVTTFTKKAANEMVERLGAMLEGSSIDLNKLLIGTFHSICYRIIRQFGHFLGMQNYGIADDRDSTEIMKQVLADLSSNDQSFIASLPDEDTSIYKGTEGRFGGFDHKKIKRMVSKLKSSANTVEAYSNSPGRNPFVSLIYALYQDRLRKNLLLDFDDCLLECYRLITQYPALRFVEHVLVDEFQDTNEIQLRLMYEFAKGSPNSGSRDNVTIVGDPDQSIYAFRDAQSTNFNTMKLHYVAQGLDVKQIMLDQNYRSTSDILEIAETIMRQQGDRLQKKLKSQHQISFKPVHATLGSTAKEAKWIVYQILHLMALPKFVKYADIAILVRSAYQTRAIEAELVRCGIPYHMVRGKAFWERKEVKAIIDYLRIIANPNDKLAYSRTINFPKRGAGDKTLQVIDEYIGSSTLDDNRTVHSCIKEIANSTVETKIPIKIRIAIAEFIELIERCRALLEEFQQTENVDHLLDMFNIAFTDSGLQREYEEEESQVANIMEVQRFLMEYEPRDESIAGDTDVELEDDRNHLSKFITSIGLFESEADNEKAKEKIAVSTIHGSKGLEWAVVFVPGLSEGLLPASFAIDGGGEEDVNEERRCFYVATTRAKLLLYISSVVEDGAAWQGFRQPLVKESRFLNPLKSSTVQRQNAFDEWSRLEKLYNLYGVDNIEEFDLQKFNMAYKHAVEEFLQGNQTRVDPHNWKSHVGTGVSKASQERTVDNQKYQEIVEARKRLKQKQRNTSMNRPNRGGKRPYTVAAFKPPRPYAAAAFKPPRPLAVTAADGHNDSRAPEYIASKNK